MTIQSQYDGITIKEYQSFCETTAQTPKIAIINETPGLGISQTEHSPADYLYTILGLCGEAGEAGEVAEKIKKIVRNKGGHFSPDDIVEITKELGDVMWYVSYLCSQLHIELQDVLSLNVEKLSSRLDRNVIKSEGDNR